MKRFSVYVLFGVTIFILVSVYDLWFTRQHWLSFYKESFGVSADRLNDEVMAARYIYQGLGDLDRLHNYLESRRRTANINFWVIYKDGEVLESSMDPFEQEMVEFDLSRGNDEVVTHPEYTNYFYTVDQLDEHHKLVVGLRFNPKLFLQEEFKWAASNLARYIIGILAVCIGAFIFFVRDIVRAIRSLSERGARSFKTLKANSKEAELLTRGMAAYDDHAKRLAKERDVMTEQVLSSLRSEILSGRTPPYSFDCTLVRTDINNFSTIYNTHSVEEFAATINDFFLDVTHIVSRYGGYVHEFIGDEVIYYFKDEEVGNSVATAISAIRDINAAAMKYHRMTMSERGYPFTVKSSLAHGSLRFGRFVEGYGISGPILIETVRILSTVAEKDGCVAVFDGRHCEAIEGFASSESYAEVKLKGFSDTRRLVRYTGHESIHKWLAADKVSDLEELKYYRSDADIATVLNWLRENWRTAPNDKVAKVIAILRLFNVTRSSDEVQAGLFSWLREMISAARESHKKEELRTLASAVRLTENLLPKGETPQEAEEILHSALDVPDRRVVANALDAIAVISEEASKRARQLVDHPDNRIAANALVHEGMRDISSFVLKRLRQMLKSDEDLRVSSGLYALGEIADYHRKRDAVYYETQLGFLRLLRTLPDYAFHSDERVRRQAVIAARKAAIPEVIAAIEQRARLAIHAEYADEVLALMEANGMLHKAA